MRRNMMGSFLVAAAASVSLAMGVSAPALAQKAVATPVRVRGTIVHYSPQTLQVRTREGKTVDIALAKGWMVAGIAPAKISDIKQGDYVGIASLPNQDGRDGALEVLIFPAAMKGLGEGSYGWDLRPKSTMTNATVANTVKGVDGRTVILAYHGKEKKISIPEGTPVVTLARATKDDLKPGVAVFVSAETSAHGAITAKRVLVGNNGVVPPM